MECLIENDYLTSWVLQYGPISLFILLALGIVALPIPEETLMVLTGIIMQDGQLPINATLLAAYGGSICGITMSYTLGRTAGIFFVHKYGKWVGLKQQQLDKVHVWFEKWGKWTLLIGYFIPGVRHFTGFTAGTTALEYPTFAIFAYVGAFLWVSTFISVGYFFGHHCHAIFKFLELNGEEFVFGTAACAIVAYLIYRWYK